MEEERIAHELLEVNHCVGHLARMVEGGCRTRLTAEQRATVDCFLDEYNKHMGEADRLLRGGGVSDDRF